MWQPKWSALGHLPEALEFYERSDAIAAAHANDVEHAYLVAHYRRYSELLATIGDEAGARRSLRNALSAAARAPTLLTEHAQVLNLMARSSAARGDATDELETQRLLLTSLTELKRRLPPEHPSTLQVVHDLCDQELRTKLVSGTYCEEARRALGSASVESRMKLDLLLQQSRRAVVSQDGAEESRYAIDGVAVAMTLATPDALARAYFRAAQALRDKQRDISILFGKRAIEQIELQRDEFADDDRRFERGFISDKLSTYREVGDWLMAAGRLDEGLEVLAMMKNEELYEFVVRDAKLGSEARADLFTLNERALIASLEKRLGPAGGDKRRDRTLTSRSRAGTSVEEAKRLRALAAGARRDEATRSQRLAGWISEQERTNGKDLPIKELSASAEQVRALRNQFDEHTAVVIFLLHNDRLRAIIATTEGEALSTTALDADQLRREVGRFIAAIEAREDTDELATSLFKQVMGPVVARLNDNRNRILKLIIWPDDVLRYLPFDALQVDTVRLVDRYQTEIYAQGRERSAQDGAAAREQVRAFGVTQAVGGFAALPAVADELCAIVRGPVAGLVEPKASCGKSAKAMRGEGFADSAFTAERLQSVLTPGKGFSVLHLGTHFNLRPGNSLRSYLVLGDGARYRVDQLAALDFSGVRLVTLSACETGMGGGDGGEVEALSTIVQQRGAEQVVSTLWPVQDASASLFMSELYAALTATQFDVGAALATARKRVRDFVDSSGRKPYLHPYYWAGFVLTGSGAHASQ